jgi:hypothetical protein
MDKVQKLCNSESYFLSWLFKDAVTIESTEPRVTQLMEWELAGNTKVLAGNWPQFRRVHHKSQSRCEAGY